MTSRVSVMLKQKVPWTLTNISFLYQSLIHLEPQITESSFLLLLADPVFKSDFANVSLHSRA